MKITNSSIETLGNQGISGANGASAIGAGGSSRSGRLASQSDSVNLSSAGQLLNLAKASGSSVGSARVANIAALVRSGQYTTDTSSLSQAVVAGHIR